MFVDKKTKPQTSVHDSIIQHPARLVTVSLLAILIILIGFWWLQLQINHWLAPKTTVKSTTVVATSTPSGLPENPLAEITDWLQNATPEQTQAQNLLFSQFYQPQIINLTNHYQPPKLPLNIKSQAINYYQVARQIPLSDSQLDDLNQHGFTIIDQPSKPSQDFFSLYQNLRAQNLPLFFSTDFLLYYYQNSLKQIFQTLETGLFYDDFWQINQKLFTVADNRYRQHYKNSGPTADPTLEGERLNALYFAVALELLQPTPEQIAKTKELNAGAKFSKMESGQYTFKLPDYLQVDATKELTLIRQAHATNLSPALLYPIDYRQFQLPNTTGANQKLRNFYLAGRWANSLFPLYPKSETCPNCVLDQNDWLINQIAAHLISQDIAADQDLQNKWARIYKIVGYFQGLRNDLTYLNYHQAVVKNYPQQTVEQIFAVTKANQSLAVAQKLQQTIASAQFLPLDGGLKAQPQNQGLRLIQDFYWPSQYLADQLVSQDLIGPGTGQQTIQPPSSCWVDNLTSWRCRPSGYDWLALLGLQPSNQDWQTNQAYDGYQTKLQQLQQQYQALGLGRYNNLFWFTLNLAHLTATPQPDWPDTTWTDKADRTALAATLNAELPPDTLQIGQWINPRLGTLTNADSYNYLENNTALVGEMYAQTLMVFKGLYALGAVRDNNKDLGDLLKSLNRLKLMMIKETAGDDLTPDDWSFLNGLIYQYQLTASGTHSRDLPALGQAKPVRQSLATPRLLLFVKNQKGVLNLTVGPIFNYQEK